MVVRKTTNILIAGVGGQGNRTLMKLIASAALEAHEDVRALSSTSLGRLGGPITCHIRIGSAVSATIPTGEADILVALEMNEALRALPMMRRGALAFIYTYCRLPILAGINDMHYPSIEEIAKVSRIKGITGIFVPECLSSLEGHVAEQGQYSVSANIIMLGILCGYTSLFPRSFVEQSLCQCLPEWAAQSSRALTIGWQYGKKLRG
jgi:indolepyruvate ferredoxin oxidoreductase beta subunit